MIAPASRRSKWLHASLTAFLAVLGSLPSSEAAEPKTAWRAAAVKVVVTPGEPMFLAGFGNRVVPAEGTSLALEAKALAIEDVGTKSKVVIVTLDLLDVPILLREELERYVAAKHQLPRESLLVNCSHTHCGPELRFAEVELAAVAYHRAAMCRRYNRILVEKLTKLIDGALAELAPATLGYGHARCGFAMNRRLKSEPFDPAEPYLNRPNPDGVVDHDVPVLKIESSDGKVAAVLFGYACHNTTLNLKQFHSDYAGFAQKAVEARHPGAVAMFLMGCGGDQNGYSLRLKRELAGKAAVWVAGYSNDVFAYVPSKRVLLEGGYEAKRAMAYVTNPVMPGPFEPTVEETIVTGVFKLVEAVSK